jgi:Protein of unknown function (DUF2585)
VTESLKTRWLRVQILAILFFMTVAAGAEFAMGRRPWGIAGIPGLWSGSIWSEHNSQYFLDPYSFTHVLHGVVFYALLSLAFRNMPVISRLVIAVGLEAGWEVLENSTLIIERYRAETISLNYFGDSIVNSMGDILSCITGFVLASRLPVRVTIIGLIAVEVLLAILIRDNLTLNLVMLIHPSHAIRMWQLGH